MNEDVIQINKRVWDRNVENANPWTVPVTAEQIAAARQGDWQVLLTNCRPVPCDWFPPMAGLEILCLASGGGQQAPIFAAAGAKVTSLDISPAQLAQDRMVAEREGLRIRTIEGNMADLSIFADETFDLIFHPVSNLFCPEIRPVWLEAYRVLRKGGTLLSGFVNPVLFLFDKDLEEQGIYQLRYSLPYADHTSMSEAERIRLFGADSAIEFGHTLEGQIGGQTDAGFHIIGFYESYVDDEKVKDYLPTFIATRALKP